ncbi:MAG: DNA translocase FtsK [Lentimicrobiaceae bacterium]|nr:DNA translocase FtsK [Lentimicrobiaceae bacterium]
MANRVRTSVVRKEVKKPKSKKQPKESKPKKTSSAKSSKNGKSFWKSFAAFCKSPITHTVFGLFLFLFTVFLFLSFFSFYQTHEENHILYKTHEKDNHIFNLNFFATVGCGEEATNNMGILGLYFSFLFIKYFLGAASFGLLFLGVVYAYRLVFKRNLLPPIKTTVLILYAVLFVSLFLALFTEKEVIAGSMGLYFRNVLIEKIGHTGYVLMLLFLASILFIAFGGLALMKKKNKTDEGENTENEHEITPLVEEDDEKDVKPSFFARLFGKKEKQGNSKRDKEFEDKDTYLSAKDDFTEEIKKSAKISPSEEKLILESIQGEDILIDDFEVESIENEDLFPENEEEPIEEIEEIEEGKDKEEVWEDIYEKLGPYDPRADLPNFIFPSIELLENYENVLRTREQKEIEIAANKLRIKTALENFKIYIQSISAIEGPTITLYEIVPDPGIRISRIKGLEDDIALSLAALGIRIIAPMPGKGTIGIEVPNTTAQIVPMKSVISSEKFQHADSMVLPIAIGKTISNEPFVFDLAKMPHVLMAGATGQGKSVGLNAILASLLYRKHPSELKFVLVDPKKVELTLYTKIERHYLAKLPDAEEAIITDTKKVVRTLNSLCFEMDQRYELLKTAQCRNIVEYNNKFKGRRLNPEQGHRFLPYIVLIFDEFADCIMTAGREVETPIARLAQLARAIGIHLVIATQRPSVNVITGLIKANFPARIAFRVSSKIDSRTILDSGGAESLIGKGDMLISTGNAVTRVQCALVDTPEIERICDFIGEQRGYVSALLLPEVAEEPIEGAQETDDGEFDPLFADSAREVVSKQQGSTSFLQRKFKLGYNRAGRIMDQLEREKIVGPSIGSKTREVLIKDTSTLEVFLRERGL